MKAFSELCTKYQIPSHSKNSDKIRMLLKNHTFIDLHDITTLVESDPTLRKRASTIHFGYPGFTERKTDIPVQKVVQGVGANILVMLTLGEVMSKTLVDAFEDMAGISVEEDLTWNPPRLNATYVCGSVNFQGKVNGSVSMVFENPLIFKLCENLFQPSPAHAIREIFLDVTGEFINIVTGNLQSNLFNAGLECQMGLPRVEVKKPGESHSIHQSINEDFRFSYGELACWAGIHLSPIIKTDPD